MRIENSQLDALAKNGQLHPKKVQDNEINHKLSQPVSPNSQPQGKTPQLTQLLAQINVLQRLFTTFISHSSASLPSAPAPVTDLLSQLLLPQNQSLLIPWLQQGAGKQVLSQLLKQSAQADSPLRQWLLALPADKQDEFTALLKLAGEQRLAPTAKGPTTPDSEQTLLQLHLLQPNGRELLLSVDKDTGPDARRKAAKTPQWTVKLALPVGEYDVVHAMAIWDQHSLSLGFETDNIYLLRRTEALAPLLTERLAMLGLRCEPTTFKVRQPDISGPEVEGLSLMV